MTELESMNVDGKIKPRNESFATITTKTKKVCGKNPASIS